MSDTETSTQTEDLNDNVIIEDIGSELSEESYDYDSDNVEK